MRDPVITSTVDPVEKRPRGALRLAFGLALAIGVLFVSAATASAAPCFPQPSSCGYPDATNTGVPAGTTLTDSGSVTLGSGQTLSGKNVTGTVSVTGPNVTIQNSKIHTNSGGSGETAITLEDGATNFKLVNSEVDRQRLEDQRPRVGHLEPLQQHRRPGDQFLHPRLARQLGGQGRPGPGLVHDRRRQVQRRP